MKINTSGTQTLHNLILKKYHCNNTYGIFYPYFHLGWFLRYCECSVVTLNLLTLTFEVTGASHQLNVPVQFGDNPYLHLR